MQNYTPTGCPYFEALKMQPKPLPEAGVGGGSDLLMRLKPQRMLDLAK